MYGEAEVIALMALMLVAGLIFGISFNLNKKGQ